MTVEINDVAIMIVREDIWIYHIKESITLSLQEEPLATFSV